MKRRQVEHTLMEVKEGDSHKGVQGHRGRIRQGRRSVLCIRQYEGRRHIRLSWHSHFGWYKSRWECHRMNSNMKLIPIWHGERMGLQRGWSSYRSQKKFPHSQTSAGAAQPCFFPTFPPPKLFSKAGSRDRGQLLKCWYHCLLQNIG